MKKLLSLIIAISLSLGIAKADEGMWLLPLVNKLNMADMKKAGLKLTAEQIYSINKTSLKDAIVIFGGGCTGEIISNQGLILTNHHCGYGAIQQHSSVEKNYLENGFWANTLQDEIYTPDLTITFLERIEDVTDKVNAYLADSKNEKERGEKEVKMCDSIEQEVKAISPHCKTLVTPLFGGNTYYLFVYKEYTDIRMVGAPPSSIGKFGADTDNWMWPRQTGDFSLFRVYADNDGNPAPYSASNKPLTPKHHLPISLKGVQENDFAMVLGYPGRTQRYMTSWEVDQRMKIDNANRIKIRGIRQDIMMADMEAEPKVRIQYSAKYSSSSNYWKNSIGMNKALAKLKVYEQKRSQEAEFEKWIGQDPSLKAKYGNALSTIEAAVKGRTEASNAMQYASETLLRGSEIVSLASSMLPIYKSITDTVPMPDSVMNKMKIDLVKNVDRFYKNYNEPTDVKITKAMFKLYVDDVPKHMQADIFKEIEGDYNNYVANLYKHTMFTDSVKVRAFINNPSLEFIEKDPVFILAKSLQDKSDTLKKANEVYANNFKEGHRQYIKGLMETKPLYPDANFTMRLTYGKVAGYEPADGAYYKYYTTLKGVMEKEDPNNWEFVVPQKLKDLYKNKDFGKYADKNGEMPVNFIFGGDITGGNSGSPVLNAKGELIGTAFDGNWEAMSGDIAFEHNMQRCINVDIRYTLFIIDKFAGSKRLIEEMTIK